MAGEQYLLEDDETMEVMKITSLLQGFWRRKVTPTVEFIVRESYYRDNYGEPTGGMYSMGSSLHVYSI